MSDTDLVDTNLPDEHPTIKAKTYTIITPVRLKAPIVRDWIVGALEGGSHYWINDISINTRPTEKYLFRVDIPFLGGSLKITDDDGSYILNEPSIQKGLEIMAQKYPEHFADFLAGHDDASTSDILLQCCLFEEAIYG